MSKNIIFNYNLESYKKKYRNNRYKLLSFSKKEIEDFNKKKKNKNVDFLLKNRKWALIGDTYYEIPKAPRWTWFRNLNGGIQFAACALLTGGIACAAVFPALYATIWKPITAGVDEKVKEYVEIETKEKLEVGKEAVIELSIKDSAKETKQLPSDPKALKVYTGGVLLDYWQKPITVTNTIYNSKYTSFADSISRNDTEVEPDNYYSYYYTKDKADLYIKKILGPVVVDMVLEDRSITVTLDTRNENEDTPTTIEVKKDTKITEEQKQKMVIEDTDYRKWDGNWYLDGSDEPFNFNTAITAPITLYPKYTKGTKTGFYIKGLKTIVKEDRYSNDIKKAFKKGNDIIGNLYDIQDEKTFTDLFDDYFVVEQADGSNKYYANLTWYVFGDVSFPFEYTNFYYFSFGRADRTLGDRFYLYSTNLIGITKDAKISTYHRFYSMDNTEDDAYKTPFNVKDIEFDYKQYYTFGDDKNDFVFFGQAANILPGSEFVLNVDHCKFDDVLFISQGNNMNLNIQNSTFVGDENYSYALEIDDETGPGSTTRVDKLVLKNNTFNGSRPDSAEKGGYRKCLCLNSRYMYGTIDSNTFYKVHTNGEGKIGDSVVQFAQGKQYEVINNTFEECGANVFMLYEELPDITPDINLIINNNTIKNCKYIGVNEPGYNVYSQYHLTSSGNKIEFDETKGFADPTKKCGFGGTTADPDIYECVEGGKGATHIFYINKNN